MFLIRRSYILVLVIILLLGNGYLLGSMSIIEQLGLAVLLFTLASDGYLLYRTNGIRAPRQCAGRLPNGDDSDVSLRIESRYSCPMNLAVIDEAPVIFQQRDVHFELSLRPNKGKTVTYQLRPTHRGEYGFESIRVFSTTRTGLMSRRSTCGKSETIEVYPSYLILHQYELLAISDNLAELGIKHICRAGHQTEFGQTREYVKEDGYHIINQKANACHYQLMVSVYQDERNQQIYSAINRGRAVQQAFRGMALLDYVINAPLVFSYVAMRKDDRVGLTTLNEHSDTFVSASRQVGQVQTLLENLCEQETTLGETDFSVFCVHLGKHMNERNFLMLYTNFSNMTSLNRQLVYLQQPARQHRMLVVFFEDTNLKEHIAEKPETVEGYYQHVIAERLVFKKRLIVSILK